MTLWDIINIPLDFVAGLLESGWIYVLLIALVILAIWVLFL
jgi:hypothetical protein